MTCFLFDKIIFGPVISRRLGISLGINLLPRNKKICTFDCIYCECGWTKPDSYSLETCVDKKDVKNALEKTLIQILNNKSGLDNITFGGNGEPTLHPFFSEIVDDAISLRNKYFPEVNISVLTNATKLDDMSVVKALEKIDNPILKLDAGTESTYQIINKPMIDISQKQIVNNIINAHLNNAIIQSLFLKGNYKGIEIDNTRETDLKLWLEQVQQINPKSVMIYSIARETPAQGLKKVSIMELDSIAQRVKDMGIQIQSY